MTYTKKWIKDKFNTLNRAGFVVNNFSSPKKAWGGQRGFVDHTILGKQVTYIIETKIGDDEISSDKQFEILSLDNDSIFLCNGHNTELIISYILDPCEEVLRDLLEVKKEHCQKYLLKKIKKIK